MRAVSLWLPLLALPLSACFQGPAGPKGEVGDPSPAGADGADGEDGEDGTDGKDGQDGADGNHGQDGQDGHDGQDGLDGEDGQDGLDGEDGATIDGQDGQDGQDGADGQDGVDGTDGIDGHDGDAPWGILLTIDGVSGGTGPDGQLQPGDFAVVAFTLVDDLGAPYSLDLLSGLAFQVAGPIEHRQILIDADVLGDTLSAPVYNGAGSWTYTLPIPVPDVYEPVANDTPDLGEADGDWGGLPVEDGTYTVAGWAWLEVEREDGSTWYDGGGGAGDVLVGDATTLESRELVSTDLCVDCHGDNFYAHGGTQRDVEVCGVCHVAGAEDAWSATDPSTTPAATIAWNVMMHQLHAGGSLTLNGAPTDETLEGWPDYNAHDYGTVAFPRWPMGVGTCSACHTDEPAEPNRAACGACHEAVEWATGAGHTGGAQVDDADCAGCHSAADIEGYHADPRELSDGFEIEIDGVTGGTGTLGQLLPDDVVSVEFHILAADGTRYTAAAVDSLYLVLSGPLDHMQEGYKDTAFVDGSSLTTSISVNSASNLVATFTMPATYAAQENDTPDLGEADGDWGGLPVVSGTWRLALGGYASFTDADGNTQLDPDSAVVDLLVGEDAASADVRDVVAVDNCLACHGELLAHGGEREGYEYCVSCHTGGAEDRYSGTDSSVTPGVTIEWTSLIHKIHNGENLDTPFEVAGYAASSNYAINSFEDVGFPRMDGGTAACVSCHDGSDAYQAPSTAVCLTCHDDDDDAAHAAVTTDDVYGESCDICHAAGSTYDVDSVHDPLR